MKTITDSLSWQDAQVLNRYKKIEGKWQQIQVKLENCH